MAYFPIAQISKTILAAASIAALCAASALACSPAPSCWMQSSSEYLRSVCQGYAKDHRTLKQIATYVEEPEKVISFGQACKRLGINLRSK